MNQAIKCICRSRLPFPVLHIDSTWKFNEMIAFRDRTAQHLGLDLLVHVNEEGRAAGVGRFTHGSGLHTNIMKNPGTENRHSICAASTRPSAARGATRRRRGYFLSEQRNTAGTRRPSARNSGSSTIPVRTKVNRSGSFRYRTGRNSTSGTISGWKTSRSCHFTILPRAPWWSVTAW